MEKPGDWEIMKKPGFLYKKPGLFNMYNSKILVWQKKFYIIVKTFLSSSNFLMKKQI